MKTRTLLITALILGAGALFALPHQANAACRANQKLFTVITRDADGKLVPNMNFIVYHENTDPDGNPYLGSSLGSGKTDAGGQTAICVASSEPYAMKFYEYSADYGYTLLWHGSIPADGTGFRVEVRLSYLQAIFRDAEGALLKDVAYDLYIQEYDADGQAIIGESKLNKSKIISNKYNTGIIGATRSYLGAGNYVLGIHGSGNTYFFLWDQCIGQSQAIKLDYRLGTTRFMFENALGGLLKNHAFTVYQQAYDARNAPILGTAVASSLTTGATGKRDLYLPPGMYAVRIAGSHSGSIYYRWRVLATAETLTKVQYRLSTLRLITHDSNGRLVTNKPFIIGKQGTDAAGKPVIEKTLYSSNTGLLGFADVYLTAGRYSLTMDKKTTFYIDVFDNQITIVDWPRNISYRPTGEMALTSSVLNSALTVQMLPTVTIKGLSGFKRTASWAYRVRAAKVNVAYNATFFFNANKLKAAGINTDKLRLAYYNDGTKQWKYVGRINVTGQIATVTAKDIGLLVLVETK